MKLYDAFGTFLAVVAGPGSFADDGELVDVAVDAKGRVLAIDPARRTVRVFQRKDESNDK